MKLFKKQKGFIKAKGRAVNVEILNAIIGQRKNSFQLKLSLLFCFFLLRLFLIYRTCIFYF